MSADTPTSLVEETGMKDVSSNDEESPPASPKFPAPSEFLNSLPKSTERADGSSASPAQSTGIAKPTVDAQGRTLNPRSCVTCRRRKVKCDKVHPCSNCVRQHIECLFPAPGRAPRKMRKLGETGSNRELLERLRRLEGVVKHLGVDVPGDNKGPSDTVDRERKASGASANETPAAPVPTVAERREGSQQPRPEGQQTMSDEAFQARTELMDEARRGRFENRFGRLVINEGKSRYINSSFWANLSNEVEDLKGILNQSDEDSDADSPENPFGGTGAHQGFVFGYSSQNTDLHNLHPLPAQVATYWQIFKDNVDPLVKVLHVPSIERTILSAASHLGNLSKAFEALLFAIYYGVATSLTQEGCLTKLGEDRAILLSRYRFAVEQALARANLLTTEEIVVLQAFVIFLMCLRRNSEARVIWTLTGLVVRIAQTIGIHRDGLHFSLPPFEVEMRRRLWWQVCILDTRASEDHGCDPTIIEQAFDTKMPLNINDIDIDPKSKTFPEERVGCTDMSFCLIRFEVANTFRRINYIPPGSSQCLNFFASVTLRDKERWITECHKRLEERYLKHCDMTVPLFWVTATVARLMMSKMWLMVYHPFQRQDGGQSLPEQIKEKLFITSLENIEYSILLETEARTMKWGWLFRTYMQWHALAFILSELCHRNKGELVERAWLALEKTRDGRWGEHVANDSKAGHLWRPLERLYKKARQAREIGLQEEKSAKLHESGQMPKRHYSPNANPMFGHPKRPQMVRAPLSLAQLQRFSQGPLYGAQPLDSHELLKSPKLPESNSESNPMETSAPVPLQRSPGQDEHNALAYSMPSSGLYSTGNPNTYGQQVMFKPGTSANAAPTFGVGFNPPPNAGDGTIDFSNVAFSTSSGTSFPVLQPTAVNGTSTAQTTAPTAFGQLPAALTPPNINDRLRNGSGDSTGALDVDIMDASEDLNWENWDQLVRQFGMEVDATGASGEQLGAVEVGWAGPPNWGNSGMGIGGSWGGSANMTGDWF